ncbi:MAG TPA: Rne/Rng family ribonuclease [Elusimicrobiota bacterium]|nr:Rne/Rng family ribonuclease [Elusimicrobiota bacterium]
MKKEIIANCAQEETRVALLEDGRMTELFIDRPALGISKLVGNIYKGRVENVLPGISSAFVNVGFEKNAYLYITDVLSENNERNIEKMLRKGDQIMVQVAKEAIGTKGMKVTMDISLPGRFLILMPKSEHIGVSKQLMNKPERERLRKIVESLNPPGGVIVRTEAENVSDRELAREMKYLMRVWDETQKKFEASPTGTLIHREVGLTFQVARDIMNEQVDIYLIDSRDEYLDVKRYMEMLVPEYADRIQHYTGRTPVFEAFGVEQEIAKLRHQRVDLPSGGYIIIQEAESLCAIDVNTGKFTGDKSQEETVTATNLEAATEVARQLRLRNIGGIIVIDFIDMRRRRNQHKVVDHLLKITRSDRAKIKILPITRLGLVEMTRERRRESLLSLLSEPCAECDGSGWVLSRESTYLKLEKEIKNMTQGRTDGRLRLLLPPAVADFVRQRQERLEKNLRRSIEIQSDPTLAWQDYRITLE